MQHVVKLMQQEAISAAEAKLGRSVTSVERVGIQRIGSLMMLESVCQSFAFPGYTAAQVLADLEYFSKPTT
ncbi:MAG TPA: hypothetical protein VKZ53_32360 [Candidatus Angelobacter sp.]|nr:hypothetical protein [Candidatus Angelobacter sp.]